MRKQLYTFFLSVAIQILSLWPAVLQAQDYSGKVNTLIGTQGNGWSSGYLYPGATYPFGMVQFTPTYFSKQLGFVINQLSGAGCDHMGNFPTLPLSGELRTSPDSIINLRASLTRILCNLCQRQYTG